jgi:hypothetical protein
MLKLLDRSINGMRPQLIHLLGLALAVSGAVARALAAESSSNETNAILFGVTNSILIISGKFGPTFSGGGGATSTVKVDQIIKAPQGFQNPTQITVYWTTQKEDKYQMGNTNSLLFFLSPYSTNKDVGYVDVTDKHHPFAHANDANMRFLRSQLQKQK